LNRIHFIKKSLALGLILLVINLLLGQVLKSFEREVHTSRGQIFSEFRWESYHHQTSNIDVLILGSSHAYRSYNPSVMNVALNHKPNVFNFGSSAQSPLTSYCLLKNTLEKHRPKLVVMDIYYMVYTGISQLKNARINWDFIESRKAKNTFFSNAFSPIEQLKLLLFPTAVYKDSLKPLLKKVLGRSSNFKNKGKYLSNGFVANNDTVSMEALQNQNQFDFFEIGLKAFKSKHLKSTQQIIDLCKKENIPLLLVTAPMPKVSVQKIKDYDLIHQFFAQLAQDNEIKYIDFNIDRIKKIEDTFHFHNDDHLNYSGANIVSSNLAKIINREHLGLFEQ